MNWLPRGSSRRWLIVPFALFAVGATDKPDTLDPGPDPTWERAVPLAEDAIKRSLIDPQSAQIEWPYNFVSGTLKAFLRKRHAGWYTCGQVNAKNRMGGYTGRVWFLVMIKSGVVTELDIGTVDGADPATQTCPGLVAQRALPPAPAPIPVPPVTGAAASTPLTNGAYVAAANSGARDAAAKGGLGISYQATLYGVFIAAVAPGSPAEKAGLKPGQVIDSINGIGVKGLDQPTIGKIFAGAGGTVSLGIIGTGIVQVIRAGK